jgi:hydrogenase maturation protease
MKKILLHAYGNPGRGDDGLGNEFIKEIERWLAENNLDVVTTDSSYQLNIEDASIIAEFDIVIFIDATRAEIESHSFTQIQPQATQTFTTHSISPSSLFALCKELYTRSPLVYLLQIKGYQWEFGVGLSVQAKENLEHALKFSFDLISDFQNQE